MAETYPLLIGGEKKESKETIPVRFPFTGELYCTVSQATNADLKAAVTKAAAGFGKTRRLPTHARAEILENLADAIHRRAGFPAARPSVGLARPHVVDQTPDAVDLSPLDHLQGLQPAQRPVRSLKPLRDEVLLHDLPKGFQEPL